MPNPVVKPIEADLAPAGGTSPGSSPQLSPPSGVAGDVVRLTLVSGKSRRKLMQLGSSEAVRHVVIGSSSACGWRVSARGVRSRHLRLAVCRGKVRLVEQCEPGAVRADGRAVSGRLELCCETRLSFGDAVLLVEPARRRPR